MNKVILSGRITKDHDLRYSPSGKAVLKTNLAVDDGFGDNKKTYFPTIVLFDKKAESTATHTEKGGRVNIVGRITTGDYMKGDIKIYTTEIIVDEIEFTDFKGSGGQQSQPAQTNRDPFSDDGKPIDISEDDLPF